MSTIEFPALTPTSDRSPEEPPGDQHEGGDPQPEEERTPELVESAPDAEPPAQDHVEADEPESPVEPLEVMSAAPETAPNEPALEAAPTNLLPVEAALCPFCGAPLPAERPFCPTCGQPGTPLAEGVVPHGRLRITGILAVSNTGAVYVGHDDKHKREVVIKELLAPPGDSAEERTALAERFRQEIRRLSHLKHPCLPEIFDHFQADGRFYMVMPLLPTQSLQVGLTQRGRGWGEQQVRTWGVQLLDLLEYLERQHPPVVHGEILPEHLALKEDGAPCLLGYGLAPRLGLRPYTTLPGQIIEPVLPATPKRKKRGKKSGEPTEELAGYLAQVGASPTPRDDLYAVGATLHALLTGRDVFAGTEESGPAFPPVRALAPRVSVGMAEAVGEAVAEDPRRRFLSAGAMKAHLLQQGAVPVAVAAPLSTPARATPRAPLPAVVLLLVVLAIVAGVLLYAHSNAGTTSPGVAEGQHEVNPLVAAVAAPAAGHTVRFADTFVLPNSHWPDVASVAYRQDGLFWLANHQGTLPMKVTRAAYATGPDGFALSATVRLFQGPAGAAYGIVAADRGAGGAENVSLLLRATGQWALIRYQGGTATPLVDWRSSSAVRAGHNAPNQLLLTLHKGAYTVTINGRKVAGPIPAGNDAVGRVGLAAWPGAVVACDALAVDPPGPVGPSLEEDFLDNARGWSASPGGAPLFHGKMLRLRTAAGQSWRIASSLRAGAPAGALSYSAETMLHLTGGAGGLVFARGHGTTLAAVVGSDGRARVVALGTGTTRTLLGPMAGPRIRTGYGLNLVHLLISETHGILHAQLVVNGGTVFRYATPARGLTPAVALVTVGPGTTVDYNFLRIAR